MRKANCKNQLLNLNGSDQQRFSGELDGNLNSIHGHNFGCPSLFLETAWEENTEDLMRGFHDLGLDLEQTISTTFNWQELGYMAPPDCKGNVFRLISLEDKRRCGCEDMAVSVTGSLCRVTCYVTVHSPW